VLLARARAFLGCRQRRRRCVVTIVRQAGTLFPRTLRGPSRSDALGIPVLSQLGRAAVKRWLAEARAPQGNVTSTGFNTIARQIAP